MKFKLREVKVREFVGLGEHESGYCIYSRSVVDELRYCIVDLEERYALDIETDQIYPILFQNENGSYAKDIKRMDQGNHYGYALGYLFPNIYTEEMLLKIDHTIELMETEKGRKEIAKKFVAYEKKMPFSEYQTEDPDRKCIEGPRRILRILRKNRFKED